MPRKEIEFDADTRFVLKWFIEVACVGAKEAALRMGIAPVAALRVARREGYKQSSLGRTYTDLNGVVRRVCGCCEVAKVLDEFPKDKTRALGKSFTCKVCRGKHLSSKVSGESRGLAKSKGEGHPPPPG